MCGLFVEFRALVREIGLVRTADPQVVQPAGHELNGIAEPVAAQAQLVADHAQALDATVHVFNDNA